MPEYCIVTTDDKWINITFGVYSLQPAPTGLIPKERFIGKNDVVLDRVGDDVIDVHIEFNKQKFQFSINGSPGTLKIQSVNGVAPSTNLDLYNKLKEALKSDLI